MANLKSKRPFVLGFPTSELLEMFGLPGLENDLTESWSYYDYGVENLLDSDLHLERDDVGNVLDHHDNVLPDEAIDDLISAAYAATNSGTQGRFEKEVRYALALCLDTFSQYPYEYFSEQDFKTYSGVASGLVSFEIGRDATLITAMPDTAHIINDCIAGYGAFDVGEDLEGEDPEEFVQTRFHHLARYWEIYGDRKPEPNLRDVEDFDRKYWHELVREVEQQYGLKLL